MMAATRHAGRCPLAGARELQRHYSRTLSAPQVAHLLVGARERRDVATVSQAVEARLNEPHAVRRSVDDDRYRLVLSP